MDKLTLESSRILLKNRRVLSTFKLSKSVLMQLMST